MKRYLKVFGLVSILTFFAACKSDDDAKAAPPKAYGPQYVEEKAKIESYLKSHYISVDEITFDVIFDSLPADGSKTSIWDQTEYPLQQKQVLLNGVDYTIYYIKLREGEGKAFTRADNVKAAYRGIVFDGTQFDYMPFPEQFLSLTQLVEGWQEIMPLFKTGIYVDVPNSPDPPAFENFGAGIMFLPSDFGYYNATRPNIPAYSPLIFNFKVYDAEYTDIDGDGILNKDETVPGTDIKNYDTDGDGTPNYLDTDDDNDGRFTTEEINDPDTGNPYPFEEIPTCSESSTLKKHLDPACY